MHWESLDFARKFNPNQIDMTLQDFFNLISTHPTATVGFFLLVPLIAFLTGLIVRGQGHQAPWKYMYTLLLYLACIPGIFAISLNIYLFLFERQSVLNMNLITQVLPFISMVTTLLIVRRDVDLDYIPGFDKLSGLIVIIGAALVIMWIVDRTRLLIFSYMRIEIVLLALVGLLIALRLGWRKIAN
jgi:hypothetical protein